MSTTPERLRAKAEADGFISRIAALSRELEEGSIQSFYPAYYELRRRQVRNMAPYITPQKLATLEVGGLILEERLFGQLISEDASWKPEGMLAHPEFQRLTKGIGRFIRIGLEGAGSEEERAQQMEALIDFADGYHKVLAHIEEEYRGQTAAVAESTP